MAVRKRIRAIEKENLRIKDTEESKASGEGAFGKLKKPKIFIPLTVIIVAGILLYFKGLFVAAIVNGQIISRFSIIQELEKRDGKQALSSLITQTLILQEAQKKNIDVSQEELDEETKKISDSLSKQGQNLEQLISLQGLTKKDFIEQLRIQKLVEKMLASEIEVTDKDIAEYIERNKSNIPEDMKPKEVTASAQQQLRQEKLSSKGKTWLEKLQKDAKILRFVNY